MTDAPKCAGCVAGYPVNADGLHYYQSTLVPEQMLTDPCTTPAEERQRREYQVPVGGLTPELQKTLLRDTLNALRTALPPEAMIGIFVVHEGKLAHLTHGNPMGLAEGIRAWLGRLARRN